MPRLSKENIRALWIITMMLDNQEWAQQDIIKWLNNITYILDVAKKMEIKNEENHDKLVKIMADLLNHESSKHQMGIVDGMVSRIMIQFKEIANRKKVETSGRGADRVYYQLKSTSNVLLIILTFYEGLNLDLSLLEILKKNFIRSPYAQNIINNNLVQEIEDKNNLKFDSDEKDIILNIIKESPNALILSFANTDFFQGESAEANQKGGVMGAYDMESLKKYFIFLLQLNLGRDIDYYEFYWGNVPFSFEISTIFDSNKQKKEKLANWEHPDDRAPIVLNEINGKYLDLLVKPFFQKAEKNMVKTSLQTGLHAISDFSVQNIINGIIDLSDENKKVNNYYSPR